MFVSRFHLPLLCTHSHTHTHTHAHTHTHTDNQQLRNFTSCPSAPHSHKSFLFLEAQEGEQCSITVPAGSEPLTWMFNGKVVYRGTCSCYQLTADHDSTGIYMCLARDTLLLTCIVQLKNLGATGEIVDHGPGCCRFQNGCSKNGKQCDITVNGNMYNNYECRNDKQEN